MSEVAVDPTQAMFPIHKISWFYFTQSSPFPVSLVSVLTTCYSFFITMASMVAHKEKCLSFTTITTIGSFLCFTLFIGSVSLPRRWGPLERLRQGTSERPRADVGVVQQGWRRSTGGRRQPGMSARWLRAVLSPVAS